MAQQLLALVTVNFWSCQSVLRPPCLSRDSVRVHTCEESRATGGLASPRLHRLTSPQNSATVGRRPTGGVPLVHPPLLFTASSSSLSSFKSPLWNETDRQSDSSSVKRRRGSPVLSYLWTETLWAAPCHWEGTSTTKTRAFHKVLLISTAARGRHLWKK